MSLISSSLLTLLLIIFNASYQLLARTLPIKKRTAQSAPLTLMLDPAGDAKHTGRILDDDTFERGVTLQFAEKLKEILEEDYPTIRFILTRFPGETLEPLQNANFANRLDVDFYISFHFYQETEPWPKVFLYYFLYNPVTDFWTKENHDLFFYPYDQAHIQHIAITKQCGEKMRDVLQDNIYKKQFDFKGLFGIPFTPLIGIKAPAIAFEASLIHKNDWEYYIEPVIKSLEPILLILKK